MVSSRLVGWILAIALSGLLAGKAVAADLADSFDARFQASFKVAALDLRGADRVAPARPMSREPFGLSGMPAGTAILATRWRLVERDIRAELQSVALCRAEPSTCTPAALQFIAIVDAARKRDGRARIGEINRAINLALRPMSDLAQYGAPDLWSPPLRALASGAGDCEDYAIAKFVALREAGIAEADLRLVVVHEGGPDGYHAVASVRLDGRWLILDNRRLVIMDDAAVDSRPILALRADDADDDSPSDQSAVAVASNGAQSFGAWNAPALLM